LVDAGGQVASRARRDADDGPERIAPDRCGAAWLAEVALRGFAQDVRLGPPQAARHAPETLVLLPGEIDLLADHARHAMYVHRGGCGGASPPPGDAAPRHSSRMSSTSSPATSTSRVSSRATASDGAASFGVRLKSPSIRPPAAARGRAPGSA